MPKVKPERVYGIVALSYLVLIPASLYFMWQRIRSVDRDVTILWETLNMSNSPEITDDASVERLKGAILRNG